MQDALNAMRGEAERVLRGRASTRIGVVDAVDPARHAVRVRVQPNDLLTGWLPVATLAAGQGWGLHILPGVGQQVVVDFQEGGGEAGIVRGVLFSDRALPPGTAAGAWHLRHPQGGFIRLNPDGTVDVGNAAGTLRQLMTEAAMQVFNTHTHPGPGTVPAQQMTAAAHLTQHLKAT